MTKQPRKHSLCGFDANLTGGAYGPLPPTPLCSDSQGKPAVPARFFGQGGKLVYDSLDETVEVLSEAREPAQSLCRGFVTNPCPTAVL